MTALRDPFDVTHKKDIKNKQGEVVAQVDYVGWSQSADRLDEAAPEQWSFSIMAIGEDWVHGRLTIGDRWFENIGYAENADASWKKEALKDAVSDAFKRCAALAGVARYLYDKDAPRGRQNGHSAPAPRPVPVRSSTAVPESLDDLDWEELSPARPVATRAEGTMWSKELFERAEKANIDKRQISDTAKRMFGKDHWRVTELDDGQRFALAVELDLA